LALDLRRNAVVKVALALPVSTENPSDRQEKITREILTYCVAHPDAKDTLGGILKWWFPARPSPWRAEEVKSALDHITAKGWVTRRMIGQAEQIYGLNKVKIGEINLFLGNARSTCQGE
jgi:hypothetical protein